MEMLNMLARALIVFMNLDFNHWLFHFVKVRLRYLANVANLTAPAVLSQKSLSNIHANVELLHVPRPSVLIEKTRLISGDSLLSFA